MDWFPIFIDLKGAPCLVVGGGAVAARKAAQLAGAGGRVRVVAHRIGDSIRAMAERWMLEVSASGFEPSALDGMRLVVAATDDREFNRSVAEAARLRAIPVNVVDDPGLSSFIMPAIVDRSPLIVAIGTSGAAPMLARAVKAKIEAMLPARLSGLAALMGRSRAAVARAIRNPVVRRRLWERVIAGPVATRALCGDEAGATRLLAEEMRRMAVAAPPAGEVYIVGAGPGDPNLLTLRALQLMQQADVVLHDRLVSPEILALVRRDAEVLDTGKRCGDHLLRESEINHQSEINQLMIAMARAGKRVLRLKGGDPSIFGRMGEELEALAAAGIPYQVVPGITAASGCAAYAGIPLTHRDYSSQCVLVTAHGKDGAKEPDWQSLARAGQTLVFYMSRLEAGSICRKLIDHGLPPVTSAALIADGTRVTQEVLIATVATLPGMLAGRRIDAPALIIVGEVARLHQQLAWFGPSAREPLDHAAIAGPNGFSMDALAQHP
jgi:uroporphyrin-III C-methyltransferase / precorrin-2 dehydrogenase / sirohydrochlorin ferrochelatase